MYQINVDSIYNVCGWVFYRQTMIRINNGWVDCQNFRQKIRKRWSKEINPNECMEAQNEAKCQHSHRSINKGWYISMD